MDTSNIKTIVGIPKAAALKIFEDDTWFMGQVSEEPTGSGQYVVKPGSDRYVTYTIVGDSVTHIERQKGPGAGIHKIDIAAAHSLLNGENYPEEALFKNGVNSELFAAFLFSVNGNKGPYENVIEFVKNSNPRDTYSDMEYKFIGHMSWAIANAGYAIKYDPLATIIMKNTNDNIYKDLKMTDINFDMLRDMHNNTHVNNSNNSGNKIKLLFRAFRKVVETESNNKDLKEGLRMDLDRATNFLGMAKEQLHNQGGKGIKNTKKQRSKRSKSRKTRSKKAKSKSKCGNRVRK